MNEIFGGEASVEIIERQVAYTLEHGDGRPPPARSRADGWDGRNFGHNLCELKGGEACLHEYGNRQSRQCGNDRSTIVRLLAPSRLPNGVEKKKR